MNECPEKTIVKAQLDDGRIIEVDAASEKRNVPMYAGMKYVGTGYYHSINGKSGSSVHPTEKHHFWVSS